MRRALVLSTVHPPDDPRLRYKLLPTLQRDWHVRYACRTPGPSSIDGFSYEPLRGGRLRRDLAATRLLLCRTYDVASVHDPELLPAVVAAALAGRTVVFDLHENAPAQLSTRPGWPVLARIVGARLVRWLLRLTARVAHVTVAEAGYAELFDRTVPVFPNFLAVPGVKPRAPDEHGGVVYLGDVTRARGVDLAVRAVAESGTGLPFDVIGRCRPSLANELASIAGGLGVVLRLHGFLPLDEALEVVAGSVVAVSPLRDMPNYRHSLPTKVLDYLAVGVPVVASDLPGTADAVGDAAGVELVAAGDVSAMAAALRAAAGDDQRRRAAAAQTNLIRDRFAWPGTEVAAYYDSLAD